MNLTDMIEWKDAETNIVEWLRGCRDWPDGTHAAHLKAADEIERMRIELDRANCPVRGPGPD